MEIHTGLFLKIFYCDKKTPLFPPIVINDHLISGFREMANFLNLYFAKQCKTIALPTEKNYLAVDFEDQDILKIIRTFDINKAHVHENILTRMIKLGDSSFVKSLPIKFRHSLNYGSLSDNWKRSNIAPVHKTETSI